MVKDYDLRVDYISAKPGMGKTYWATDRIVQRSVQELGVTIYVGPTEALLEEVRAELLRKFADKGIPEEEADQRIIMVTSSFLDNTSISNAIRLLHLEEPKIGRVYYRSLYKDSTILLMCHEGFYAMPLDSIASDVKRTTQVIVDEARMILQVGSLDFKVEKNNLDEFKSLFKISEVDFSEDYVRLQLKASKVKAAKKFITSLPKSKSKKNEYTGRRPIKADAFLTFAKDPRVEVYVSKKSLEKPSYLYIVMNPLRIFGDYAKVTMMCADFTTTQAYHTFTRSKKVKMQDLTNQVYNVDRDTALIARLSRTKIIPLTLRQEALTQTALRGLLVRRKDWTEICDVLIKKDVSPELLKDALAHIRKKKLPPSTSRSLLDLIDHLRDSDLNDPIPWMLSTASKFRKQRKAKFEAREEARKKKKSTYKIRQFSNPLLTINSKFARYLNDKRYDGKKFTHISTSSHGLNIYSDSNMVVYLSAINLDGPGKAFIQQYLGEWYDYERDYTVNTCLQTVYRCSLRDIKSKERVLILVPDLYLASSLSNALGIGVNVDTETTQKLGGYDFITDSSYNAEIKRRAAQAKLASSEVKQRKSRKELREKLKLEAYKHYSIPDSASEEEKKKAYKRYVNLLRAQDEKELRALRRKKYYYEGLPNPLTDKQRIEYKKVLAAMVKLGK